MGSNSNSEKEASPWAEQGRWNLSRDWTEDLPILGWLRAGRVGAGERIWPGSHVTRS